MTLSLRVRDGLEQEIVNLTLEMLELDRRIRNIQWLLKHAEFMPPDYHAYREALPKQTWGLET